MKNLQMKTTLLSLLVIFIVIKLQGQNHNYYNSYWKNTAVPFLLIAPDARAAAMGNTGVSSAPDASSMFWNPSKYAFMDKNFGIDLSFVSSYSSTFIPLPQIKGPLLEIYLLSLSAFKKLGDNHTIAFSMRYYSLGEIDFTDPNGQEYFTAHPKEIDADISSSFKINHNLSGGIAIRYIYSDLTNGISLQGSGTQTHAGESLAADISLFYQKPVTIRKSNCKFRFGLDISNIGSRISYIDNYQGDFIPANLRLGPALTIDFNNIHSLSFEIDANKMLVPTAPIIDPNSGEIIKGKNANVSVMQGIFQSFYDAPYGFKEELHEIAYSFGMEYWFKKIIAVRSGYHYEYPYFGVKAINYYTVGAGIRYSDFGLDFSYLIPNKHNLILYDSFHLTCKFQLDSFHKTTENLTPKL
jgi:hypothetical protein